jgi:hypothetical protein
MAVNKLKNPTIHEILKMVGKAQTRQEKVAILKQYNCLALRDILKGSFDDQIQFLLPKGEPPYEPAPLENPPSSLYKMSKQFKYFAVGGPGERMPKHKVEAKFISVLESIHPDDAALVIKMKDKKVKGVYKGLTPMIINEAFPNLISKS